MILCEKHACLDTGWRDIVVERLVSASLVPSDVLPGNPSRVVR